MKFRILRSNYYVTIIKKPFCIQLEYRVGHMNCHNNHSLYLKKGDNLKGLVAIVTGGYKGIGLSIAQRLLQDGAIVIITGRNEEGLGKIVREINNPSLHYMVWDVSKSNSFDACFREIVELYGVPSILVNNAGVTSDMRGCRLNFLELDEKQLHYVHDINYWGTVNMCELFEKYCAKRSTVLNIISNTALLPAYDAYTTSKWALYYYTINHYKNKKDVTGNGLCPGPVKTDMSFNSSASLYRSEIPNHRIAMPEEIGELAYIVICAGLNGISGNNYISDGGESLV